MVKIVIELCCYLENKPGNLAEVAKRLAEKKININGIVTYEGQLQSLVRIAVDNVDLAEKVLRGMGVDLVSRYELLEVDVINKVGGLAKIAAVLGENGINIESIYATGGGTEYALAYIRVSDLDQAKSILENL